MADTSDVERQWYWDRRTRTALYPRRRADDTVEFVTVWHAEEVADAVDGGALVPVDEVGLDRTETTFDLIDSFRFPAGVENEDPADDTAGTDGGA
ncbi:MAG: hypothetical protein V5A44_05550 [Haloarculaceae archaeon]